MTSSTFIFVWLFRRGADDTKNSISTHQEPQFEGGEIENMPVLRDDVVRESDRNDEVELPDSGESGSTCVTLRVPCIIGAAVDSRPVFWLCKNGNFNRFFFFLFSPKWAW